MKKNTKNGLPRTRKVEIDVDGVLANLDGSYAPYVKPLIPDFTEEKYIRSWNMIDVEEKSPEAMKIIRDLWVNPTHMGNLRRFPHVVDGFRILGSIPNLEIVVHTHILQTKAVQSRYKWVERVLKDAGVSNASIDICVGKKKTMHSDSYYVIEDSPANLAKSPAKVKFMVRRCHNRAFNADDIGTAEYKKVVPSFYEAAKLIYMDMMGEEYAAKTTANP